MIRNFFLLASVVLCLTALVSCGGGGGGSDDGGGSGGNASNTLGANLACLDEDGDGYGSRSCGGADCDDADPDVNPIARDICGDNIDQNCDGVDRLCTDGGAAAHSGLAWDGSLAFACPAIGVKPRICMPQPTISGREMPCT